MPNNLLISGIPHSGKSTLLERIITGIGPKRGFITKEVKPGDTRTGFEIITSEGTKGLLASANIQSPIRVSRYGVDVASFERVLPPLFYFDKEVLYIDEIGRMELYSDTFQRLVQTYLDAPNRFIGTLSTIYFHPFIDAVRARTDVTLFNLTPENREEMFRKIQGHSSIFQ